MNLLLDTNVLIDYLGRKKPFFEDAERLMAMGYFGDAKLWAPIQSFKDAFYVLAHYVDSEKIQAAMLALLDLVHPVDLSGGDLATAAKLKWVDFEDCLVAVSAAKAGADYVVTRDRKGFDRSLVPIISPADLLRQMSEEGGVTYGAVEIESIQP